jgi:hypothetical protein
MPPRRSQRSRPGMTSFVVNSCFDMAADRLFHSHPV